MPCPIRQNLHGSETSHCLRPIAVFACALAGALLTAGCVDSMYGTAVTRQQAGNRRGGEVVYRPDDSVLPMMTPSQAQEIIKSLENSWVNGVQYRNIQISSDKYAFDLVRKFSAFAYNSRQFFPTDDSYRVDHYESDLKSMNILVAINNDGSGFVVRPGSMKCEWHDHATKRDADMMRTLCEIAHMPYQSDRPLEDCSNDPMWATVDKNAAISMANALYVLKRYSEGYLPDDPATEAAFAAEAKTYRELPAKPALAEDVQRCRVMAEDAFNNKDFEKALQYYRKGLAINPLWPQGQFNAALLEGELHKYQPAALHMRHYLELVPDAANAKTAQEKMYLWEEKAKEEAQKPGEQGK